jgi:hypothetical protein
MIASCHLDEMRIGHSPFLFHNLGTDDNTARLYTPVSGRTIMLMHDLGARGMAPPRVHSMTPISGSISFGCNITHEEERSFPPMSGTRQIRGPSRISPRESTQWRA